MKKHKLYYCVTFLFIVTCFRFVVQARDLPSSSSGILQSEKNCYVYISLDSARSIVVYRLNAADGALEFVGNVDGGGSIGALTVDPTHTYLYAAVRSKNCISAYRIDPSSGDLFFLKTVHAAGNPVNLSTDRTGKFLLTAYFADSKAAVYAIGNDGVPIDSALQIFPTEKNAHAFVTDLSNRYAFIPCRTGEAILQYIFNPADGSLTSNTPDRVLTDSLTGPRHIAFHTAMPVVYFSNEFGSTVTAYHLDTLKGTLSAFQTLSMLPPDFSSTNKAADIHLTPDNRFLYAANRGHESIAAYSVDSLTGKLTSIGQVATEKTPRSFDIDPGGRFLYAGGQGSGKLAAYRIDPKSGKLTLFETYDVGNHPAWVLVVEAGMK